MVPQPYTPVASHNARHLEKGQLTDSSTRPQFSDDRQWWWTGSEWVPASQAPQPTAKIENAADAELIGTSSEGAPTAGSTVRNAASGGLKAVGWLANKAADQAKKQGEQIKAKREAAAAQAAAVQAQHDAWFAELQRECPLPLDKRRIFLPGGLQLMQDECLVSTAKHWGFSSDRLVLTTHRLVWSHGRVTKDSEQLYLTDIRDVRYHKPLVGTGTLTVEAAGQHSLEGLLHMKHAPQFRDSLLTMVHYAKQRSQRVVVNVPASANAATAPAPDKFAQLKKLAELKEQGILTDEEFQSEKAKLLSN
jgi:putative oligomerization/nucleic acid binding protein